MRGKIAIRVPPTNRRPHHRNPIDRDPGALSVTPGEVCPDAYRRAGRRHVARLFSRCTEFAWGFNMEPYPPRRQPPSYALWFVVIAVAVCVGTLAANAVEFYVATEGVNLYIRGFKRSMTKQLAESRRRSESYSAELRNERAHSPEGRQLAANCHDWRQELKQLNTPTVRKAVTAHCDAYEKYLERGY